MKTHCHILQVVALLLMSCAGPAPDFSRINLGMEKTEVITRLGQPDSMSANEQSEKLIYGRWDDNFGDWRFGGGRYYVNLDKGRVSGYGKIGDYLTNTGSKSRASTPGLSSPMIMMPPIAPVTPFNFNLPAPAPSPYQQTRIYDVKRRDSETIEVRERPRLFGN
jgi:hypothetical protein